MWNWLLRKYNACLFWQPFKTTTKFLNITFTSILGLLKALWNFFSLKKKTKNKTFWTMSQNPLASLIHWIFTSYTSFMFFYFLFLFHFYSSHQKTLAVRSRQGYKIDRINNSSPRLSYSSKVRPLKM